MVAQRARCAHHVEVASSQWCGPSNFSTALPPSESELVQQLIKDPYHLDFLDLSAQATEAERPDMLAAVVDAAAAATVNTDGIGHAEATRPWSLDDTTQRSVIIHALPTAANGTAGARLACIDLDGHP